MTMYKVECNIDDMNPELYSYLLDELLALGAKDAWLTPIIMKKGRPAICLTVLVVDGDLDIVKEYVFHHTTSIGLRYYPVEREVCERSFSEINYMGHIIHIKTALYKEQVVNISLEYEDVKKASQALAIPVKVLEQELLKLL